MTPPLESVSNGVSSQASKVGHLLPTPPQLARDFEAGLLSRTQFQAAMSLHANELIDEMAEAHENPMAAFLESVLNRRAAKKIASRYSEVEIRRALVALSAAPGFPLASLLWNAGHWDVPLSCFLRTNREPVFRIHEFGYEDGFHKIVVAHGDRRRGKATKETFLLDREPTGSLRVVSRRVG